MAAVPSMSSNSFQEDSSGVRLLPWRTSREVQNPDESRPRKPVFGEARVNREAPKSRAEDDQEKFREAWQKGFEAGEKASRQAGENELRRQLEHLARTTAQIAGLRSETLQRAESDVVRLSIEIARRILHREIAAGHTALESLIRAALEKLKHQEIHRVRVSPGEEEVVNSSLEQAGRGTAVEVVVEASRPRGSVVFEISRGSLDASVHTQLAEIERDLLDELRMRAAT